MEKNIKICGDIFDILSYRRLNWHLSKEVHFVYDNWNVIEEREIVQSQIINRKYYLWGIDLNGTEHGAGGVGGLLAVQNNSTLYLPYYDANGNITAYTDTAGVTVYTCEYTPFGKVFASTGTSPCSFGFSTQYTDTQTSLVYYGYRYYSPELGRWLSRDPIGEEGGWNLYLTLSNNLLNYIDALGNKRVLSVRGMKFEWDEQSKRWRVAKGSKIGKPGTFLSSRKVAEILRKELKKEIEALNKATSRLAQIGARNRLRNFMRVIFSQLSQNMNPYSSSTPDFTIFLSIFKALDEFSQKDGNCIAALKQFKAGYCKEGREKGSKCAEDVSFAAGGAGITAGTIAIHIQDLLNEFFDNLDSKCCEAKRK